MKTYPFIRVLIQLLTLLLLILIGLFASLVFDGLFSERVEVTAKLATASTATTPTVSPELLATITTGKKLFKINCGSCHNRNMKSDMIGPALAGVRDRWSDYPISDLYNWVKNSSKLVEEEHPRAITIYKEWNRSTMTTFSGMTDEEVEAILVYIENVK